MTDTYTLVLTPEQIEDLCIEYGCGRVPPPANLIHAIERAAIQAYQRQQRPIEAAQQDGSYAALTWPKRSKTDERVSAPKEKCNQGDQPREVCVDADSDPMFKDLEARVESLDAECARLEAENDELKSAAKSSAGKLRVGDRRTSAYGAEWVCTDPDIDRWVCNTKPPSPEQPVIARFPAYTQYMGIAAQNYFDSFKYAHSLPAQFAWREVWNAMIDAASLPEEPCDDCNGRTR